MRAIALSALGLAALAIAASAQAQYRDGYYSGQDFRELNKIEREYRKKYAKEREECRKKENDADSRSEWRKAQRECREKLAEVEREYRKKLREEVLASDARAPSYYETLVATIGVTELRPGLVGARVPGVVGADGGAFYMVKGDAASVLRCRHGQTTHTLGAQARERQRHAAGLVVAALLGHCVAGKALGGTAGPASSAASSNSSTPPPPPPPHELPRAHMSAWARDDARPG